MATLYPAERIGRFVSIFGVVAAIVASLRTVEVIPEFSTMPRSRSATCCDAMWPVAWRHYPQGVHAPLMDSLHIRHAGDSSGGADGRAGPFLAARNVTPYAWLNYAAN